MEENHANLPAMRTPMGTWRRTGKLFLVTHSCYMAAPFCGLLNGRKLFLCQQPRANMLPRLTQQRKPCGFDPLFPKSLTSLSTLQLYFPTISWLSRLLKIISIMLTRNILTCAFILFVG